MDDREQRRRFIRQTFDRVAPEYGNGACRFFHNSGQLMASLLSLRGDESVLDVATGTGATALPLARCLPDGRVTAVDFSAGMLERAARAAAAEGLTNVDFAQHDMTRLPFDSGSFDHVTCAFGLFFVDDMETTLADLVSLVKPGGRILISGFRGDSFQPMAQLLLDRLRDCGIEIPEQFGWQRMSEPEQLQALFSAAGCDEPAIERHSLGYRVSVDDWWNVVWSAGFRGFVEQLGPAIEDFKQAHFADLRPLADSDGLWLDIDVNFTSAFRPA